MLCQIEEPAVWHAFITSHHMECATRGIAHDSILYLHSVHSARDTVCRRNCPVVADRRRRNWVTKGSFVSFRKGSGIMAVSTNGTIFSDKVPLKLIGQVTAGFGAATAFVDMQMPDGFSIISSYAEKKLEVLSMANGCGPVSRKPAEGSREFWPTLTWTKGRSTSERYLDSSRGFFEVKCTSDCCLGLPDDIVVIQASSSSKSASNSWITSARDSSSAFSRIPCWYSPRNKSWVRSLTILDSSGGARLRKRSEKLCTATIETVSR
jgi:hypothetical protein